MDNLPSPYPKARDVSSEVSASHFPNTLERTAHKHQHLTTGGLPSIETIVLKAQTRWCGHCVRMSEDRLPKTVLYGEISEQQRSAGGQKKRYKDQLHYNLKALNIDAQSWEDFAMDRSKWRAAVWRGAENFEQ